MDKTQTFQRWSLETVVATLQQRYPEFCPIIMEKNPEQIVIQLDRFVITITSQGMVEVTAPTNSHQQVEQLAIEIEQLLRQANPHTQDQVSH